MIRSNVCVLAIIVVVFTRCAAVHAQYAVEAVDDAWSSPLKFGGTGCGDPAGPSVIAARVISLSCIALQPAIFVERSGIDRRGRSAHAEVVELLFHRLVADQSIHDGRIDRRELSDAFPGMTAVIFLPIDHAVVEVSENGTPWTSLGDTAFDVPMTRLHRPDDRLPGRAAPTAISKKPFVGGPDQLQQPNILTRQAQTCLLLAGSGGGKWRTSGHRPGQGRRFRSKVADDLSAGTKLNLDLDGDRFPHAAMGAVTVPEPVWWYWRALRWRFAQCAFVSLRVGDDEDGKRSKSPGTDNVHRKPVHFIVQRTCDYSHQDTDGQHAEARDHCKLRF